MSALLIINANQWKAYLIYLHYACKECWLDLYMVRDEVATCIASNTTFGDVSLYGTDELLNRLGFSKPDFSRSQSHPVYCFFFCCIFTVFSSAAFQYARMYANISSSWTCLSYLTDLEHQARLVTQSVTLKCFTTVTMVWWKECGPAGIRCRATLLLIELRIHIHSEINHLIIFRILKLLHDYWA